MGYIIAISAVVAFALCVLFMLGAGFGKDESADINKESEPKKSIKAKQLRMQKQRQGKSEESLSEKDLLLQRQFYRDYENIISYDGCEQKK